MGDQLKGRVFVGGLPYSAKDADLKRFFTKYGEIREASVVVDSHTGASRGFGFVTFKRAADADYLVRQVKTASFEGRQVDLRRADPKSDEDLSAGRRQKGPRRGRREERGRSREREPDRKKKQESG